MYYSQCAPYGAAGRYRHQLPQRAPVNVYKTDTSYELLIFAPGRVKENFSVKAQGNELIISYKPEEGLPTPNWIRLEYSRGAFDRSLTIDETIDVTNIKASYTDGVLQVSLPIIPGKEAPEHQVEIN